MASIRRIDGKSGPSFKITVTSGRDIDDKQVRHYLTWTPLQGMTERQMEKAVQKAAFEFEQKIEQGIFADKRQIFAQYAEYVIDLKARCGAKHRTIERYRQLLVRINKAVGYMKLGDIRPQHLNSLYASLAEEGVRGSGSKATPIVDFAVLLGSKKMTRACLAECAGVAPATVTVLTKGNSVSEQSAMAVADALAMSLESLFAVEKDTSPLSSKTITEYHRLISTILTQAEKELLIPYNPAHKATPPKLMRREVECFQPDEVQKINKCLENEPIKWRAITHLLLITGCRRGEIMGLHWSAIDWKNSQIKIERSLLYAKDIGVYEDSTKSGTTRYIKVPNETIQLLKRYQIWFNEMRFKNGDRWHDTGCVFTKDNGEPMNPESITAWLRDFSNRNGLPKINPHKFRHTMASLLFFNGLDSVTISKRLGHAKVSTTTDIYSHIIKQADELAADCIADVILRGKNAG